MKKTASEDTSPPPVTPAPPTVGQPLPPTTQNTTAPLQPYREDPGQTYGIIGIVLNAIGFGPGGIIFGIMSRNKSRAGGFSPTLGTVSLIWGVVNTALAALVILAYIGFFILIVTTSSAPHSPTLPLPSDAESSQFELNI